jgi:poly(A) polymerase
MDPFSGEVLDLVGGRADLAAGVIRAIGQPERRFEEDHLRLLRAVRFAARLGFEIEAGTLDAASRLSPEIHTVSPERIREELVRILIEGGARRGFELLDATGLLHEILPEIERMKGVEQPPQFHPEGDVWVHTLIMLEGLRNPTPELALGVLLHDVGKPPTFRVADRIRFDGHPEVGVEIARGILERLRFSNDSIEQVLALVSHHMRFMSAPKMNASTLKRFIRMERFDEHLELHRLDCLGSNGRLGTWEFVRSKLAELPAEQLRPPRLLTGDDLIAEGFKPGPRMKEILTALEDAQLEGTLGSREQALEFVHSRFGLLH